MSVRRFAAYPFEGDDDLPFDATSFSRFKYGSDRCAQAFARELATKFIASPTFDIVTNAAWDRRKLFVYPPPYINLPTAAFRLTTVFVDSLNESLHALGLPAAHLGKVYRARLLLRLRKHERSERNALFDGETFYADAHLLRTTLSLFVDDVWITGGHERRILKMLDAAQVDHESNCLFLYLAKLENENCDPSIEHRINAHAIHDHRSILSIIREDGMVWNTRVVKYVLSLPPIDFDEFIQSLGDEHGRMLYHSAINNGYAGMDECRRNFGRLSDHSHGDRSSRDAATSMRSHANLRATETPSDPATSNVVLQRHRGSD